MKFVIYRGQKKITVDNAEVPFMNYLETLKHDYPMLGFGPEDLPLINTQITSSMGMMEDGEIDEGIKWRQETVN